MSSNVSDVSSADIRPDCRPRNRASPPGRFRSQIKRSRKSLGTRNRVRIVRETARNFRGDESYRAVYSIVVAPPKHRRSRERVIRKINVAPAASAVLTFVPAIANNVDGTISVTGAIVICRRGDTLIDSVIARLSKHVSKNVRQS